MSAPSLNGRMFTVASNEHGLVDGRTRFAYREQGGVISASYAGGAVVHGHLVGTRVGDELDFRYVNLSTAGETATGHCTATVTVADDGRLRLHETWAWESQVGSGTSVVEEIPGGGALPGVLPLGVCAGIRAGQRLDLLSIETWPDRWDLRFARSAVTLDAPSLPRRIPPADAWQVRDDLGTRYEVIDVNGRGDRDRSTGEVQLQPDLHPGAASLTVTVALVTGQPDLEAIVDVR